MKGRTALVTGGGSGIGRAISRRFAAEGAAVIVADVVGERAVSDDASWVTGEVLRVDGGLLGGERANGARARR